MADEWDEECHKPASVSKPNRDMDNEWSGTRGSNVQKSNENGWAADTPSRNGPRSGRPNDWICNGCSKKVFGSKDTCFSCHEPKGDSPDAPPDDGSRRSGRPNDWICNGCSKKVFGSKDTCFSCHEPKGDSPDAPPDDGNQNSSRRENWTRNSDGNDGEVNNNRRKGEWDCACGHNNFASRDKCQKCLESKPQSAEGDEPPKEYYCPDDLQETELFSTGISAGINFDKFDKIPVEVIDSARNNAPRAIVSFQTSGLNELLLDNLKKSGYQNPTPIQKNAIPIILAKRDLMACAQTGSGKTAAFLLPIIQTLMAEQVDLHNGQPYVLIVTPTRELTTQIYNEARKFSQGSIIKCSQIFGGTSTRHQREHVNCHILVATPGRLLDFLEKGIIGFDNIRFVVLDEADRMLDMGFKEAVETIMNKSSKPQAGGKQVLMFSATFPTEIRRLAENYLNESIFLKIGIVGSASTDVTQSFFEVDKVLSKKRAKLMEILDAEDPRGTIVFVGTKKVADQLAVFLSESEHPTTSIHGDRKQSQREDALKDFKTGKMKVLIATAVCARGIDIPNVRHVINFDLPKDTDEYVHRIGRTGRVGNVGKATSFYCSEQDSELVNDLKNILKEAGQPVPDFFESGGSGGGGNGNSDFRDSKPAASNADIDDEGW